MQGTAFWQEWDVCLVSTHTNGTALTRMRVFALGFAKFFTMLVIRRPDVVHLNTASYGSFVRKSLLAWLSKAFRVPVVLHMHGADFLVFFANAPKPFQLVIRETLERMDILVALGDAWANELQIVAPNAKIVVVPNAVRPQSAVDQTVDGLVHVAFLGEIGDRKGTFTLLDAWAQMLADADGSLHARLTIVGDGEIDRANECVTKLALAESVEVRGWMAHADVQQLLTSAQILVLPSREEGQPMAILEAMARGLCVIASTVGGIPELLDDDCGLLVSPDSPDELAVALSYAIRDVDARSLLASNAFHRMREQFDVEVVSRRFDGLYRQIIK
jgi:glycosyltransferase involved in cell wall biosynthesis